MKRIIGICCLAIMLISMQSCFVKRSPNMAFVEKSDLAEDSEVVSLNVPGFLMKSFIRGEIRAMQNEDPVLAMAFKKIKGLKLMAIEGTKGKDLRAQFNNYLSKNNFEEMMSIYSDGAKISINTLSKKNKIKNVLLGINDGEDHVFVDLKTDIDLDELNQLVTYYEQNNKKERKFHHKDTE